MRMKKIFIRGGIALLVLIVVGVLVFAMFLDGIVKRGVETVGPTVTKTAVKLSGVSISVLGGSAKLNGFVLGNPEGYKDTNAMEADTVRVALVPSSVIADKVIIRSILIDGARINIEGSPSDNNLTKILANVQAAAGAASKPPGKGEDAGASKKLQVDDITIKNCKLSITLKLLGGKTVSAPLPDIHLSNLGQGPEGITSAALIKEILTLVTSNAGTAVLEAAKGLGGAALDSVKDLGKGGGEGVDKATKGIKDLFKKK